jgi:pimeloyl-ACP methyl ester carboxylesterase
MPVVQTDDNARIYYWTLGNGPLALILLHGWAGAGSGHSWRQVLEYLPLKESRVIVMDQRGHGGSSTGSHPFTTERLVRDVISVADDAGASRFVVVAFSMSGKWAQAMTALYPERISGQILIAPVGLAAFAMPDEMKREWIQTTRDFTKFSRFINGFTKQRLSAGILEEYFHDASTTAETTLSETLGVCSREDLSVLECQRSLATLVCGGAHDPMFSPEFLQQNICSRFALSHLEVLDCGHEIPLETPRDLAALVEKFVINLKVEAHV